MQEISLVKKERTIVMVLHASFSYMKSTVSPTPPCQGERGGGGVNVLGSNVLNQYAESM